MVEVADEAKSNGIDQISGVGRAVHSAAEELGRELPQAAGAAMIATGEIIDVKTVVLILIFWRTSSGSSRDPRLYLRSVP
jgi:hypothetical protein